MRTSKKDTIIGLENRLRALIDRNEELRRELEALHRANAELSAASNAVMISVALALGEAREDGKRVITIPRVDVKKNNAEYSVYMLLEGDKRVISVEPKGAIK